MNMSQSANSQNLKSINKNAKEYESEINKEDKIIKLLEDNKFLNNLIYALLVKELVDCPHTKLDPKVLYVYCTASTLDESVSDYEVHKCLSCDALIPMIKEKK